MTSITLAEFESFQEAGVSLIDCRPTNDFASSFISNSVNASINGSFEYMATCLFSKKEPLVIICKDHRGSEAFLRLEAEGFEDLRIFDFSKWSDEGRNTDNIIRCRAAEAHKHIKVMKDVSNSEDWEVLHVKEVPSLPLIVIIENYSIAKEGDVFYCGNGHKSMAAVSFLKSKGVNTTDIIGGLSAMLVDAPELEI